MSGHCLHVGSKWKFKESSRLSTLTWNLRKRYLIYCPHGFLLIVCWPFFWFLHSPFQDSYFFKELQKGPDFNNISTAFTTGSPIPEILFETEERQECIFIEKHNNPQSNSQRNIWQVGEHSWRVSNQVQHAELEMHIFVVLVEYTNPGTAKRNLLHHSNCSCFQISSI